MAAMINIGGVDMPSPAKYSVTLQDIDSESTRRTEAGTLIRDRVRIGAHRIGIAWQVEHSEIKQIADALAPAGYPVTFFDPHTFSYEPGRAPFFNQTGPADGLLAVKKTESRPASTPVDQERITGNKILLLRGGPPENRFDWPKLSR